MTAITRGLRWSRWNPIEGQPLTDREKYILSMIANECMHGYEIANRLGLSPKTVEAHRHNIMAKTGTKTMAALCKYYWTRVMRDV